MIEQINFLAFYKIFILICSYNVATIEIKNGDEKMARDKMLRIRVTEEEKINIEQKASALNLNVSEYLRILLLQEDEKLTLKKFKEE